VAVLDEGELGGRAPGGDAPANVRVLPIGMSMAAGARVGRLLLRLGHRRIAYVDPHPDQEWSRSRLRGLRDAFRAAGLEDGVVHVRVESSEPVGATDKRGRGLAEIVAQLGEDLDDGDELHRRLGTIVSESHNSVLGEYLFNWLVEQYLFDAVDRVLGESAPHRATTACVGANDSAAIQCLKHFERNGVAVPGDMSVVGFDDSFAAQVYGLTSYNDNGPVAVQAALDFVVDPRWAALADVARDGVVEVSGFVKERSTTGPPRRARSR
jgi:DNA-binding LacI/PurR family transcriptional regulator